MRARGAARHQTQPPLPAALKGWHGQLPVQTGTVVGPACASQGVAPDADPGEEVTLSESVKVI
jgi:hypothetical protein